MVDLAVANRTETFARIRDPLEKRGIRALHLPVRGRTVSLTDDPPWQRGAYDVGLVYPGRIMEGAVADALLEIPWVNGRDAVLDSRNKAATIARLDRAGLPVPETVLVSNPVEEDAVLEAAATIGYPLVVKPNSTTRGRGVTRVDDPDSLLGVVDYLSLVHDVPTTRDRSYLLQEFIPDATDYRVMVIDGRCVGAVRRQAPGGDRWRHSVHRGATATGVQPDEAIRDLAGETAAVLDLSYLGVDLLVADGQVTVTETNVRPTVDDPEKYDADFFDRLAQLIRSRV